MAHTESGNKYVGYLHIAIGLFMMFVLGRIIEPIYPLTDVGMQVVGVFLGVIWMWCFVGFLWPSLMSLVAFGLTDFAGFGQVMTMSFGNNVAVLLLFSMILFGSPQYVGATRYITRFFLTRKVFNNRPIVFAFVFFLATYALSIAVNVTPSLVLMWTVLYGVLRELDYKKGDRFASMMIVGTFLGAISGQASLPFTGSTLAIISVFNTASESVMPVPQYMLLGFTYSIIGLTSFSLFMKFLLKPHELEKVAHVNTSMFEKDPLPPMSRLQKANFFSMLAFVILMLLPWFLPDGFVITEFLNTLGATGVAILITAVMCLARAEGKPILDFEAVASKAINWNVYVMVAAAMAIASALTNEATGVINMMLIIFEPVLAGHTPGVYGVIMLLVGIFVTSFASSLVIGIALMPVLVVFGLEAGANLYAIAATTILLLHYSIILPSASVFAAMLWSNSEWISRKEVFSYGAVIVGIAVVAAVGIILPFANVIF